MANPRIVTITSANYDAEVTQSSVPVLLDFWAEWCGPCRMIAPVLDELSEEQAGKLKVAKVNVDENQELAMRFGIKSIPTLLLLKGGALKEQIVGALGKKDLEKKIMPHLA